MKCFKCGLGMLQGISLFRQNAKGDDGVWACEAHNEVKIYEDVADIVALIEKPDVLQ